MNTAYTIAIITILGSGVSAGAVTFWLNFWRAELDYHRAKIEELYTAVHEYTKEMPFISIKMRRGSPYSDDTFRVLSADSGRINLLIHLYFPRLLPTSNQFTLAIQDCLDRDGKRPEDFRGDFLRICEIGDKLKAEVVKLSRQGSLRAWIEDVRDYDQRHS
jgi:hypothetical protein